MHLDVGDGIRSARLGSRILSSPLDHVLYDKDKSDEKDQDQNREHREKGSAASALSLRTYAV